jgi:hypothetical protein
MFNFLKRVLIPVSDEALSAEFDILKCDRPFRCGNDTKYFEASLPDIVLIARHGVMLSEGK